MKIRTIIVDDETLARERIRKLLEADAEIEIAGEASNGLDAVKLVQKEKPALIFLDVQMPELDGFGVLEKLAREKLPAIIFVTAHDKFALKAFEVHAIDYLLKPFDRARFQIALQRAKEKIQQTSATEKVDQRFSHLIADLRSETKLPDRLAVKIEGRILVLKIDDLDWIEADGNYVKLHVGKDCHLMRETLSALETRLPAQNFFRVSRSAIVNADRIKELQPMFHGDHILLLRDGTRVTLSRNYRDKLQSWFGRE